MAKTKQRSSSASQRREEVKKQRQQRLTSNPPTQSQSRNRGRGRRKGNKLPWGLLVGALLVIAAIVGVFIYISNQHTTSTATGSTPTSVLKKVTQVDSSIFSKVGTGNVQNPLTHLKSKQPILTGPTGKPEIFYQGAEFCPYCAAQRWAVVVALSRFGTFGQLHETASAADDVYPNTSTFTFYNSTYTSSYIDFVPLEQYTNQKDNSGYYAVLQTPTTDQQRLISTYNGPPYTPQGGFPFMDVANQYLLLGPSFSPEVLTGLSQQAIADELSNPDSAVTQNIVGSANYLVASICQTTNQQPASVCTAAPIPQIEQSLGKSTFNASDTQLGVALHQFDMMTRRQD